MLFQHALETMSTYTGVGLKKLSGALCVVAEPRKWVGGRCLSGVSLPF